MTAEPVELNIRQVVTCDDIRREDNGKLILIGVYNDVVVVPQFPAALSLSFWTQLIPSRAGPTELHVKLSAGDAVFANTKAQINFPSTEVSALNVPSLPFFAQQETTLELYLRTDAKQDWKLIKKVLVTKNKNAGAPR